MAHLKKQIISFVRLVYYQEQTELFLARAPGHNAFELVSNKTISENVFHKSLDANPCFQYPFKVPLAFDQGPILPSYVSVHTLIQYVI